MGAVVKTYPPYIESGEPAGKRYDAGANRVVGSNPTGAQPPETLADV